MRRTVSALMLALLAAACGSPGAGSAASPTSTAAATSPSPTATSPPPSPSPMATTATVTATATPSTPTPTVSPTRTALVAEPDGLRAVLLGEAAASAVATMRGRFGTPDADTGWTSAASSPFGVCPGATTGAQVRGVRWDRIRLLLSDGNTDHGSAGTPHVFAYDITSFEGSGTAPTTAAGIGLGSTVSELRSASGGRVTIRAGDEVNPDRFTIRLAGGEIRGSLTGTGASDTVTFVTAGQPCGE